MARLFHSAPPTTSALLISIIVYPPTGDTKSLGMRSLLRRPEPLRNRCGLMRACSDADAETAPRTCVQWLARPQASAVALACHHRGFPSSKPSDSTGTCLSRTARGACVQRLTRPQDEHSGSLVRRLAGLLSPSPPERCRIVLRGCGGGPSLSRRCCDADPARRTCAQQLARPRDEPSGSRAPSRGIAEAQPVAKLLRRAQTLGNRPRSVADLPRYLFSPKDMCGADCEAARRARLRSGLVRSLTER